MRRRSGGPEYIPFCVPWTDGGEVREASEAIRSGWLTTGPKVAQLERRIAGLVGARHAVALNSCTAALHLGLLAAEVGPGDEVITTPYTFAATGEAILYCGARPVFADIDAESLNLAPESVRRALTRKTRAIVPVHIAGRPCDMPALRAIARRRAIPVIEDAAHALGSTVGGRSVGALSEATCFSFYATKNLTTGEGGMLTTDSKSLAQRVRRLSLHGLTRDAWRRYARRGSWRYDVVELGYKYNMTDVAAGLGLAQLRKFHEGQTRRRRLARRYTEFLSTCEGFDLPLETALGRHAWHLYIIRLRPGILRLGRDDLIEALARRGIGTSVHFLPLHLHSLYRSRFGYRAGSYPVTEAESARAISLPLYPGLGERRQDRVIGTLLDLVARHRR
jgi:dTDP-4-amino-4,6-dideoxygalactose transaminase